MSLRTKFLRSGGFRTLACISIVAALAACSSEVQRFADYPPVNKTGSLQQPSADDRVAQRPLGGSSSNRPSWQNGQAGSQTPSWQQPQSSGAIVIRPGQTLFSIARANGTTVSSLAAANNIPAPYSVNVGQRIIIPGVANPSSPAPTFVPQQVRAASAPAPSQSYGGGGMHTVQRGETLYSIGRTYNVHPDRIAQLNNLAAPHSLRAGQRLSIPNRGQVAAWNRPAPVSQEDPAPVEQQVAAPEPQDMQPLQPVQQQQDIVEDSGFRWPVRGRVISSFGVKTNGTRNEGINISVPEGTSVRAAEAGVVAYAGNELKGYGNLVLIRHRDGWVTAYAHNRELLVQRGDTVRRGDVIARAGATGSVNSPQLHFELRKGASAVDPMKHLSTSTASN